MVANVGAPGLPHSVTASIVDVATHTVIASVPMPGRTRWAVFDPQQEVFFERLFCACDAQQLVCLESRSGKVLAARELNGVPDVIFLHARLGHLYVAIGEPGLIDVFETTTLERIETVETERGAHTIALDADRDKVYAFMPQTHRAAVYVDTGA